MAFGLFKRGKEPFEVTCPHCSSCQEESPLAVSTFCKKCHSYLKLENGIAVAKQSASPVDFAKKKTEATAPVKERAIPSEEKITSAPKPFPVAAGAASAPPMAPAIRKKPKLPPRPAPPLLQEKQTKPNPDALKRKKPVIKKASLGPVKVRQKNEPPVSPPEDQQQKNNDVPFITREAGPDDRMVCCFDCATEHPTSKNSTSALCPKCGAYISLKDFDIREDFNSRIQTRGTVVIHKKGVVSSSIIECHHLTVEGEFTGAAECSGDLTIRRHSRIEGHVICKNLRIEKRAKVEFLKGADVATCEIDGTVEGNINCAGRLALHKKATLHGDIKVGTLSIDAGAKHHGQISMGA